MWSLSWNFPYFLLFPCPFSKPSMLCCLGRSCSAPQSCRGCSCPVPSQHTQTLAQRAVAWVTLLPSASYSAPYNTIDGSGVALQTQCSSGLGLTLSVLCVLDLWFFWFLNSPISRHFTFAPAWPSVYWRPFLPRRVSRVQLGNIQMWRLHHFLSSLLQWLITLTIKFTFNF